MSGLYLIKDKIILLENQKKGLCLITAFLQGLYLNNKDIHVTERMIIDDIVNAMKFVVENKSSFSHLSTKSIATISSWKDSLIDSVANGNGLHSGEFWNIEILESYIAAAKIPIGLYYYNEVNFIDNVFTTLLMHS